MNTSLRILTALAIAGLVFGAIKFTPGAATVPGDGGPSAESRTSIAEQTAQSGTCTAKAGTAGGVRHPRALLYLLR